MVDQVARLARGGEENEILDHGANGGFQADCDHAGHVKPAADPVERVPDHGRHIVSQKWSLLGGCPFEHSGIRLAAQASLLHGQDIHLRQPSLEGTEDTGVEVLVGGERQHEGDREWRSRDAAGQEALAEAPVARKSLHLLANFVG